jgi:CPA1 family monovalent cation:H+ antiporter
VRGAVSLAAALALPVDVPQRDRIVFVTFVVILASLLGPILTLPGLVRLIGIEADDSAGREDAKTRIKAAEAALARLEELMDEDWVRPDTAERLRGSYRFRANRFLARYTGEDGDGIEERSAAYQRLRRELLDAERAAVVDLRRQGVISEEVMQRVQRDIDLEDSRLDL